MRLPSDFITTIQNGFGERGREFLDNLPALIKEASQRWGLTEIQPVGNLSYNFVAYAKRPSTALVAKNIPLSTQDEVILKFGVPDRELTSEIAALRFFNGKGAVRLIEADESRWMFLLERLRPGLMLSTLEDDEQATHIAADLMLKLWQPLDSGSLVSSLQEQAPAFQNLIKLSDWFDGFKRLRAQHDGGTGPLDEKLVEKAEAIAMDFFAEHYTPTLIHGDFHHFNILSSDRGCDAGVRSAALHSGSIVLPGWLAIDPKGVIGPAAYEVGPFLFNPVPYFLNVANPKVQIEKRIGILSERLSFERERIRKWGFAHTVLSAFWSLESGDDPSYAIRCAGLF